MEDSKKELINNLLQNADSVIKWCFVLNGAACTALLTVIGSAVDKKEYFADWNHFGDSIAWFIVGLVLAVACNFSKMMSLNYFSQVNELGGDTSSMTGKSNYWGMAALSLFFGSMIGFILGVYYSGEAVFG